MFFDSERILGPPWGSALILDFALVLETFMTLLLLLILVGD